MTTRTTILIETVDDFDAALGFLLDHKPEMGAMPYMEIQPVTIGPDTDQERDVLKVTLRITEECA